MFRGLRRFGARNALGLSALSVALGGVSYAASTGSGTVRACAAGNGALFLQKGRHCAKNERGLSWAQRGPAGARGATGPQGPQGGPGPQGVPGPQGTPGDERVKWAVIESEGVIEAGRGVSRVRIVKEEATFYVVTFDRDISKCAVLASSALPQTSAAPLALPGPSSEVVVAPRTSTGEPRLGRFSIVAYC